jgi:bifunctional non-homologous end joining protein LigD
VEGKILKLSHLDKIYYSKTQFTKAQVIDYYLKIAPVLLPHIKEHPLTLKRYPHGSGKNFFYQKECPSHKPKWLKTAPVWSEKNKRNINFTLVDDVASLLWVINLATLELHTSLSLYKAISEPKVLVFDLDPGLPATILQCGQVALWLRELFFNYELKSYPKTSGSKGLQIYVPLNNSTNYEDTKDFAHKLAKLLEKQHPEDVVSKMKKSLRSGKIFIDWSQNDQHKTTVCVYSLRAKETPTVSTPVTWLEVEQAVSTNRAQILSFTCDQVLERITKYGDLFSPVLTEKKQLPRI